LWLDVSLIRRGCRGSHSFSEDQKSYESSSWLAPPARATCACFIGAGGRDVHSHTRRQRRRNPTPPPGPPPPRLRRRPARTHTAAAPAAASAAALHRNPMATTEEDPAAPLLDLVEKFPDLFDTEVLRRVDPADRAFFAQVSHGCRAAVVASELPCAGTRVGMRELNPADRARLARAVRAFDAGSGYPPLAGLVRPLVSTSQGLLRITTRARWVHDLLSCPHEVAPAATHHTHHTHGGGSAAGTGARTNGARGQWRGARV